MGAYYQSAKRNLMMIVVGFIAAAFFSWRYFDDNGSFLHLILLIMCVTGVLHGAWGFIQKEPAISFDRNGVKLQRWCGVADIPWREVHDVSTKIVTVRGTEMKWLSVACDGGLFGSRTVSVSFASLDIATGSEEMVTAAVYQAWVAAVGQSGVAMAGAGQKGWGANFYDRPEPESSFDADEAVARYQAKQGVPQGAPATAAPVVQPIETSQATPPRPVFGRKAV